MIELPEAVTLASQLAASARGRRVTRAVAGHTPHKWAWFHGDPAGYSDLLAGKTIDSATSSGGFVDVLLGDARLLFAEGVALRYHRTGERRPERHQLLIEFEDGSALSGSVQMYGGLWAYGHGAPANPYYEVAVARPSPLADDFDRGYFQRLAAAPNVAGQSAKGFLATEQRIPGLGNGVLQDILFEAAIHPKRKVQHLSDDEMEALFRSVKATLAEMARLGGRDTERDLHGAPGGYRTKMSRNTVGTPCSRCGSGIAKATYMGGSVYFCGGCQRA